MLKLLSGDGYTYFIEIFDNIQNNIHGRQIRSTIGDAPLAVCANTGFHMNIALSALPAISFLF